MKHRKILGLFSLRELWATPAFVFLTAMLLCGAVAGSFTGLRCGQLNSGMIDEVEMYLTVGVQEEQSLMALTMGSVLPPLGWFGAMLLSGLLRPHSLFLSAVSAWRGFVLSFCAAAMLSAMGREGLLLAIVSGGVSGMITVPCLLMTGAGVFMAGLDHPQGNRRGYWYTLSRYRHGLFSCLLGTMAGSVLRILAVLTYVRLNG